MLCRFSGRGRTATQRVGSLQRTYHSSAYCLQKIKTTDEAFWRWERVQTEDGPYMADKHPEIKRRYNFLSDGDHPCWAGFNPWDWNVDPENDPNDNVSIPALMKQAFREGTRNPLDLPDPDDSPFIIPPGRHEKDAPDLPKGAELIITDEETKIPE